MHRLQILHDGLPVRRAFMERGRELVEKCTLCAHLSKNGELPMCVRTCSAGARFYGDIDDPSSDASKALAAADPASIHTLQDVGNHPATHYILSPKRAAWKEGE